MTVKPVVSLTNNAWLHLLEEIAGKGRASKPFIKDVRVKVPMNDPVVTFFHCDPSYYSTLLCNSQTFLRGFGAVPKQLRNVVTFLEKDPQHPNAMVYIHGAAYSSITFSIVKGLLQCTATLCAVDVWDGLPQRTIELGVLSTYVAMGLRKQGVAVELGSLRVKIGQAYLPPNRVSPAIAAIWASGLSVNYMTRFPQAPFTMTNFAEATLANDPRYLIGTLDNHHEIFNHA